jgi:hypothetical protein
MAKVVVKKPDDILRLGREVIRQARRELTKIIADDVVDKIKSRSAGKMSPVVEYEPDKIRIIVRSESDDVEGQRLKALENQTKAFEQTHNELRQKAYIKELINRKAK